MLIPIGFFGAGGAAGAYELISSQILTSASTSIVFSSIPSTYKHLQLRMTLRGTDTGGYQEPLEIRFNSDTGSNYNSHFLRGNGTAVSSGTSGTTTRIYADPAVIGDASTAGIWAANVVDIVDYANRILSGMMGSRTNDYDIRLHSGVWLNTTAVSTITLPHAYGTGYKAGSRFSLYGIKG